MSAKEQAMNDTTGRAWQDGDYAWLNGKVWRRTTMGTGDGGAWWSNDASFGARGRTDAEMTTAGAILVATADGPVNSAKPEGSPSGDASGSLPAATALGEAQSTADAIRPQVLTEDTPEPPRAHVHEWRYTVSIEPPPFRFRTCRTCGAQEASDVEQPTRSDWRRKDRP